jgi:hypothetical protein
MARLIKTWDVSVRLKGDTYNPYYQIAADNEDDAKAVAWSVYCQEHLTDVESVNIIDASELSETFWVQS